MYSSIYVVKKSDLCLVDLFSAEVNLTHQEIQKFLKRNPDSGEYGNESIIWASWLLSLQELEEIALIAEYLGDYPPYLLKKYPTDKFAWSLVLS